MVVSIPIRWLLTLALAILMVRLSLTPGQGSADSSVFGWLVSNTPTTLQKLMHIGTYAMLTFVLVWALDDTASRGMRLLLAFVLSAGLGSVLEWYQTQIPGRFGTLFDVLLNAAGSVLGLLAALLVL